jgi:pyruvate kinase
MVDQVDELLLRYGRCEKGDVVVITAGSLTGVSGSTNLVRVHHVGEDDSPK